MQLLNRNEVDNFLASIGQPPVAVQVARRKRGIGRIRPSNTTHFQNDSYDGWNDGWGTTEYNKGDANTGMRVENDSYGTDTVLNPQLILPSGGSIPLSTVPNISNVSTDTAGNTTTASNVTNNYTQPLPGSNPNQLTYLTANPLVFQNSFSLQENYRRGLLIVQNQTTASNLYVGFGVNATVGSGLLLAPGLGILLDVKVPSNSIYGLYQSGGVGFVLEGTNNATTPIG